MKKLFLFGLISTFSLSLFAQHDGHQATQTNAKIAELAAHRIGRLVDTRKIEESYVKNLGNVEVIVLPHSNKPTDPAYNVVVSQPANDDGKSKEISMAFDMAGKFLSNKVLSTQGSRTVVWPDLDPLELIEISLHFVTETTNTTVDIKPYNKDFKKLSIKQKQADDGSIQAVILISANGVGKQLEITMSAGGDILGYAIIE